MGRRFRGKRTIRRHGTIGGDFWIGHAGETILLRCLVCDVFRARHWIGRWWRNRIYTEKPFFNDRGVGVALTPMFANKLKPFSLCITWEVFFIYFYFGCRAGLIATAIRWEFSAAGPSAGHDSSSRARAAIPGIREHDPGLFLTMPSARIRPSR